MFTSLPLRGVRGLVWCAALSAIGAGLPAQTDPVTQLERSFPQPPDAAKPRIWWHWTGGNITTDGITRDLEWMQRVGIGGFQLADVSFGRGQTVEPQVAFGSPAWFDAVRHAATEADRLGLEMALFSSPGWSITGGPWVQPEQAMKRLVWSETTVEGGQHWSGVLPPPPSNNGPIRNLRPGGNPRPGVPPDPTFYADAAVLAFRTPAAESAGDRLIPATITANGRPIDGTALIDDDLNSAVTVPAGPDGAPATVQYDFATPRIVRALTLAGRGGIPVGRVLISADGTDWRPLLTLPGAQLYRQGSVRTFAFPAASARAVRFEFSGAPLRPAETMSEAAPTPASDYVLTEAVLHTGARVHRAEEKAVFSFLFQYDTVPTPAATADATIDPSTVIDLTDRLAATGQLDWDVPPGPWTILRLGYALTGAKNRPANPSGAGFEADKLSARHMEAYYHGYFDPLREALGPLYGKTLSHVLIDSWEAGYQNWTDDLPAQFQARRGYDPTPWLPVLLGRVVGDAERSDRFLWDFRRTLADLWAENHYGVLTALLHRDGLQVYSEASGVSLEIPEDTLLNKSKVDIPMGEFWVRDLHPSLMYQQDVRGAASAGHAYGKPVIAAEAFTGGGFESPATLKAVADRWFAQGINRLVLHTSAHQPWSSKPGNVMVGTHLHRNITWAEQAGPLMTYFARTSHVLQAGRPVADLAYLLPEGAPSTPPIWGAGTQPAPPAGYDYDFINADVLLHRLTVDAAGRLTVPAGPTWSVLVLPETRALRPELVAKLADLVAAGATVVGPKPTHSPSLQNYPAADTDLQTRAEDLWGDLDGVSRTLRFVGRGRIVWGRPLTQVLADLPLTPDFDYERGLDREIVWQHRAVGDADFYYVANLTDQSQAFAARFRVAERDVERWDAETGRIELADFRAEAGRTVVPLQLGPHASTIVAFRRPAPATARATPSTPDFVLGTVADGPWQVTFPPDLGASVQVTFPHLLAWNDHPDAGVKYFSGTATYARTVQVPAAWFSADRAMILDLGSVGDLATVYLNGQRLGLVWHAPFEIDVTGALVPGDNDLRIEVTNEWTNRLVGDQALPDDRKVLGHTGVAPGGLGQGPITTAPTAGLLGPLTFKAREVNRVADMPDGEVAGLSANYTEARVAPCTLPDPLRRADGRPVTDARTWQEERRPAWVRQFEENQFGRAPPPPPDGLTVEVSEAGTLAFDGQARRRQVTLWLHPDRTGPKLEVLTYVPAAATGPVPLLLQVSFTANNLAVNDPAVRVGESWDRQQHRRVPADQGRRFGSLDVPAFMRAGLGVATINYADIDPDASDGLSAGVRAAYLAPGQTTPAPDEWGTIAAWAWGLSRVLDYFETDPTVDAQRVALFGASRLGKTVLWTAARDPRFAAVIASVSGEGGAALSRRNYGETIGHLTAPTRYAYQFAGNYAKWAADPGTSPVDGHLLVALIAPRPLLLQTGDTDRWSDPRGEWLSLLAARPVYALFGQAGPVTDAMPRTGILTGDALAYTMHAGGHGTLPGDWALFVPFLVRHLHPTSVATPRPSP